MMIRLTNTGVVLLLLAMSAALVSSATSTPGTAQAQGSSPSSSAATAMAHNTGDTTVMPTTDTTTMETTTPEVTTPSIKLDMPRILTREGDLEVSVPPEKELYFRFRGEFEDDEVLTLHGIVADLMKHADDNLETAQNELSTAKQELMDTLTVLGNDAAMDTDVEALSTGVKGQIDLLTTSLSETEQTLDTKINSMVQSAKTEATTNLETLSTSLSNVVSGLDGDINTLDNKVDTVEDTLSNSIRNTAANLDSKITSNYNTLSVHQSSATQLVQTQITTSTNTLSNAVQAQLNTLNGKTTNNANGITANGNRITSVQNSLSSAIKSNSDKITSNFQNLDTRVKANGGNIDLVAKQLRCGNLYYSTQTSTNGRCEAENNPITVKYYADNRLGADGWYDIPGRRYNVYKQGAQHESVLLFHYQDTLGINARYWDRSQQACGWRILLDGNSLGEFGTHLDTSYGWDIWPGRLVFPIETSSGVHEVRMQYYKTNFNTVECLSGWSPGSVENYMHFEEIHTSKIAIRRSMGDHRLRTAGSWYNIPNRVLSYTKKRDDTDLFLYWTDVMGYNMAGRHTHSCHVRVLLSGPKFSSLEIGSHGSYAISRYGWRIRPRGLQFLAQRKTLNMPPGTYTFVAQFMRDSNGGASECLQGWWGTGINMVVVEKDSQKTAIAPANLFSGTTRISLPDRRNRNTGWGGISNRAVTHTKTSAASIIRVTYVDTLGWASAAHTTACIWRLVITNSVRGTRDLWSHGGAHGGWRIDGYTMVWLPSVPAGTFTYQIQVVRQGGSSECLAGWSPNSSRVNNFLLVEEIFPAKAPAFANRGV